MTLVLDAFDTLFNKRDYAAAETLLSPDYIPAQRPHPAGARGLFDSSSSPADMRYENGLITPAVITWMRMSDSGMSGNPRTGSSQTSCDRNRSVAEHWNVIQDEATAEEPKSGLPMFGDNFPPQPDTELEYQR